MKPGLLLADQVALDAILLNHLARYPLMEVRDLYKLIHQGALGSEHAVTDLAAVRDWLDCELRELAAGPAGLADPLFDPVSPDRSIVRVHLRPYLAEGRDPDLLLRAFVRTAQEYRGSPYRLRQWWPRAQELAMAGGLPFRARELHEYFMRMESKGFPAVHHSPAYEAAYRPAYRVIHPAFLNAGAG